MTFPIRRQTTVAWGICAVLFAASGAGGSAQSPKRDSYVWLGELVSYDRAANTATVKAPYREHINAYISRFNRGDKLTLIWATPAPGEAEAITYIEPYNPDLTVLKNGYVLPVEFVSADPAHFQVTFTLTPPPSSVAALKTMRPGSLIKVTTPFDQPNDTPAVTAIEPSSAPNILTSSAPVAAGERRNQR